MSTDIYDALTRTAQLLRMDVFKSEPGSDRTIIDGLRATSARIVASGENLRCVAGQTAVFTLYAQLAMLGVHVDLDLPNVALHAPQPPFANRRMADALVEYSDDLLPGGTSSPAEQVQITFALGDTPCAAPCVRVSGTGTTAYVGADLESTRVRWSSAESLGAIAAGAAAAADGARVAVAGIASRLGVRVPNIKAWTFSPFRRVSLDLCPVMPARVATRQLDVISGGAITNALIFALLRAVERPRLELRVIEPESLDVSNLNRYSMARRSWVGQPKTLMLESYSDTGVTIQGLPVRLDDRTVLTLRPWADKLAVGVDDIRARWLAQAHAPRSWVGVGATSHDYVLVSEHVPGQACAGCVHPRPDDTDGTIPTIGFVSLWAGLMLALKVLGADSATTSSGIHIWPLGLDNPRGLHPFVQAVVPNCPVRCPASTTLLAS